jgi:16S rRNA A1518/A1519 N6-dimethyltransferase RsmA/KsgA/DIM1 with predicted DNA glycosylase/AP lyase activity
VTFLLFLFAVILIFGFVTLFGAPYLPTLRNQTEIALDLLEVKEGMTILELGSGDGSVALAAAKRGAIVTGYELNPILVVVSRLRCVNYRSRVKIIWGNYWAKDWPITDGIFVFLLDRYMKKLDTKIIQQYKGKHVKLVSFAFEIPNKKPVKKKSGMFLYKY